MREKGKGRGFSIILSALLTFTTVTCALAADLDAIKKQGTLRHLGVPYANFVSGSGDGLDVELCQLFAKHLGVKYEYVKTDWGTVIPDLIGKKVKAKGAEVEITEDAPVKGDMIANGFTVLPWREKVVKFSEPTFPSQIWLIARADSPVKPIIPTKDINKDIALTRALMKGKKVLSLEKTCLDPKLYDLAATGAKVIGFMGQLNELAPAIINNEAEMTILDVPDALIAIEKWPGKLKIIGPISPKQIMGAGFAQDAPKLLAEYNIFLAGIKKDGTYMKLINTYYPSARMYFPDFFKGL
ncbi:MAG: transporter substrate-binding domain-containing protein [Desulfurivibrionaceae bacterium]